jgi:predicted enzyme related to lactoylglutathione lyase
MTSAEINIAIAQACGWTDTEIVNEGGKLMYGQTEVPNYCNDLNAMHKAEMRIPEDRQAVYDTHLVAIVGKETGLMPSLQFRCIHASAKQRAKAFLRTVGKWTPQQWGATKTK